MIICVVRDKGGTLDMFFFSVIKLERFMVMVILQRLLKSDFFNFIKIFVSHSV